MIALSIFFLCKAQMTQFWGKCTNNLGIDILLLLIVIFIDFIVNLYKWAFLFFINAGINIIEEPKTFILTGNYSLLYVNRSIIHFGKELLWKHFLQYFFLKAFGCLRCQALGKHDLV